uniref:Integrase core domain containing protein n=1 Tax=Solanum tuberosum TaxID=4113 RepID=M1DI46_SOLTU
MSRIEDMMQKMMRRFGATDENVKEMRNDLSGIGQKVDAHTVSIKHLELQMTQFSTTVNSRQLGTLSSYTIQNPNNDGHCMEVTTRGGDSRDRECNREARRGNLESCPPTQTSTSFPTKQSSELPSVSAITYRVESVTEVQVDKRVGVEALATVIMNFDSDGIKEYDELLAALDKFEYRSKPKKLDLDMKNRESPPARPSVEEAPKLELKALPPYLRDEKQNLQKRTGQRFTDPIDGPWFSPRTVNGSDEENTLIGSPTGSASGSEVVSTSGSESTSAPDSGSGSATCSGSHDKAASSNEATSSGEVPMPQSYDPDPVAGEPNIWCVEGQWKIYQDAKMLNEKEKMARLITEEHIVLTGTLHTILDIHRLFQLRRCDWMARDPGTYSKEIVWEFYASYAATLRGLIDKWFKPTCQDPITSTMVRGFPVDISHTTINRFLYGPSPDHTWALNMAKFDYR